jgi:diacylglycerol kinase (ATP)
VLIPFAIYLGHSSLERAAMIACIFLVIIVELLNSSVEAAVDRISLEHHLLAKRAKDIASAAVFLSLLNLFVVWLLILWAH